MTLDQVQRQVKPFLARADEMESRNPLVSFYCRVYVAEQLVELRKEETIDGLDMILLQVMDAAERVKATIPGGVPEDGPKQMEDFALFVFTGADDEDRTGTITEKTARRFYAAALFLDILEQFGELAPDVQEKLTYSKYKAGYIMKCLKAGETPMPGGVGEDVLDAALEGEGSAVGTAVASNAGAVAAGGLAAAATTSLPPKPDPSPVNSTVNSTANQAFAGIPQQPASAPSTAAAESGLYDLPAVPAHSIATTGRSTAKTPAGNVPSSDFPVLEDPNKKAGFPDLPSVPTAMPGSGEPDGGLPHIPSVPSLGVGESPSNVGYKSNSDRNIVKKSSGSALGPPPDPITIKDLNLHDGPSPVSSKARMHRMPTVDDVRGPIAGIAGNDAPLPVAPVAASWTPPVAANLSRSDTKAAKTALKHAVSALDYDDVETAVNKIQEALSKLVPK